MQVIYSIQKCPHSAMESAKGALGREQVYCSRTERKRERGLNNELLELLPLPGSRLRRVFSCLMNKQLLYWGIHIAVIALSVDFHCLILELMSFLRLALTFVYQVEFQLIGELIQAAPFQDYSDHQ